MNFKVTSRRDDLISTAYLLFYLLNGRKFVGADYKVIEEREKGLDKEESWKIHKNTK